MDPVFPPKLHRARTQAQAMPSAPHIPVPSHALPGSGGHTEDSRGHFPSVARAQPIQVGIFVRRGEKSRPAMPLAPRGIGCALSLNSTASMCTDPCPSGLPPSLPVPERVLYTVNKDYFSLFFFPIQNAASAGGTNTYL